MAIDFFNHAAKFSEVIAFIVPNQFKKWSVQNKLNKSFKLIKESDIINTFIFNQQEVKGIYCVFQIWVRVGGDYDKTKRDLRLYERPPTEIEGLKIYQHNATKETKAYVDRDWDYAVYRQGYKDYSKLFTPKDKEHLKKIVEETSDQFFFIEVEDESLRPLIEDFDFESLSQKNTTTPGFGKADFVEEFTTKIKGEKECKSKNYLPLKL